MTRLRRLGLMAGLLMLPAAALAAATVQWVIDMRAEIAAGRFDPLRDHVGVRGHAPPLSWERSLLARPASESGTYLLNVTFDPAPQAAQRLNYKFKIEHPGQPDAGWESGRNRGVTPGEATRRIERAFGAWESGADALVIRRTGHIERIAPLPSAFVPPREVQVWLPPGYESAPQKRYPVLYMHDGQNVFDAQAAGAEWGLDETTQRLVEAGAIEPMIIVAVGSSDQRLDEMTPVTQRVDGRLVGGGAGRYADYLVRELKPLIDQRYRTRPAPEATAVGGASVAGLMSIWLLLEHAQTFGAALVVSPSVWWGDEAIVKQAARGAAQGYKVPRIWLDVGTLEPEVMVQGARHLRDALRSRGWAPRYLEQAGGSHDEASWAARVEPMLRFLYGAPARDTEPGAAR